MCEHLRDIIVSDYPWERLSSRDFEHVVQALAVRTFGATTIIWGDGPDGGREATYEGPLIDPVTGEADQGLLVIQAKYLQRPHVSAQAQSDWAIRQLRSELFKYKPTGDRPVPDAYLFVTNAILTPVSGGGKDRFLDILEDFRRKTKLKLALLWDYDELGALLDNASDIRKRYPALIASGDVLYAALHQFERANAVPVQVAINILQKEFLLEVNQPGFLDESEEEQRTADLFVDIPAEELPVESHGDRWLSQQPERFYALQRLVSGAPPWTPKLVIIGGPGQGKTTLLTMYRQLNRGALLASFNESVLSPLASSELQRVIACAERLEIPLPSNARFPLSVKVPDLARYLNAAPKDRASLWHFLGNGFQELLKTSMDATDLRVLVRETASVLTVDGYDEVNPEDRHSVLVSIVEFLDEARLMGADVAIMMTSRPQAYEKDLQKHGFIGWVLPSLTVEDASRHAMTLLNRSVDTASDVLMQRYEQAARAEDVRGLLYNPLHVRLVISLLQESGDLPRERYRLFERYYQHVYEREFRHGGELAALLGRYRSIIDELHGRLALAILMKSEGVGTGRAMHVGEFRELARAVVVDLDADDPTGNVDLVELIIRFSCERLVLIVGVETEHVGFEIKPLTEFLAAFQLNRTKDDRLVRARFRAVARASAWDDVTRFLASAIFDVKTLAYRDIRDSVIVSLRDLDDVTLLGVDALSRRGTALSIDVLADNSIEGSDCYSRYLWPDSSQVRHLEPKQCEALAALAPRMQEQIWFQRWVCELEEHVSSERGAHTAWSFINRLVDVCRPEMEQFITSALKTFSPELLTKRLPDTKSSVLLKLTELPVLLQRADPDAISMSSAPKILTDVPEWAQSAWTLMHTGGGRGRSLSAVHLEKRWPVSEPVALKDSRWLAALADMPTPHHSNWDAWIRLGKFLEAPTPSGLEALNAIGPEGYDWVTSKVVPWPVRERQIAGMAEGISVDLSAWYSAEERWRDVGVKLEDIDSYLGSGALTPEIADVGFPFSTIYWSMPGGRDDSIKSIIKDVWNIWKNRRSRYCGILAGHVLVPMCDYSLRYDLGVLGSRDVHRIVLDAANTRVGYSATASTIATALGQASGSNFVALASSLLRWSWLLEESGKVSGPVTDVIERAAQALPIDDFSELCLRFGERTNEESVWSALLTFWLRSANRSEKYDSLTSILRMTDPSRARLQDLRALARSPYSFRAVDIISNAAHWSSIDRARVRDRLAIEIGEPWLVHRRRLSSASLDDVGVSVTDRLGQLEV